MKSAELKGISDYKHTHTYLNLHLDLKLPIGGHCVSIDLS